MPDEQQSPAQDSDQRDGAPRLLSSHDAAQAYHLVRRRIDALLRGRAEVADLTVPACPEWTVRQVVAHLAGSAEAVAATGFDYVPTAAWTQAQVDRLDHHSIDELLDRWARAVDPLAVRLIEDAPDRVAGQIVFDVLTHEHDIRGALGEPGSRAGDLGYRVALGFLAANYHRAFQRSGHLTMRLSTPSLGTVRLGDPTAAVTLPALELSDFEALRAFGGRRSMRQLSALPWQGEPPNPPPAAGNDAIRPPADDLVE